MKKGSLIAYTFSLIGLFVALFFVAYGTGYSVAYFLGLYYDRITLEFIASLIYIALYGLIFFFAHRGICHLLVTTRQVNIAFAIAIILDALFFISSESSGGTFAAVNIFVLLEPLWERKRKIKNEIQSQVPQTPVYYPPQQAQNTYKCLYCGHSFTNNGIPHYCPMCSRDLLAKHLFCSECGQENNPESLFCTACGAPLKKQNTTPGD